MLPNQIDSTLRTPPNSANASINMSMGLSSNARRLGLLNAASNALAAELLNQNSGGSSRGSFAQVYSPEIFAQFSVNSQDTSSATPSPLRGAMADLSSLTLTPPSPFNLGESARTILNPNEGDQITQLCLELAGWVTDAGNSVEALDRRSAAIEIINCFHHNFATLEIHTPNITNLPACIGFLRHLKTLDLSNCEALVSLPNVLDNFFNLKELNLTNCKNLVALPNTVAALPGYSHLFLTGSGVNLANPLQSQVPSPQP